MEESLEVSETVNHKSFCSSDGGLDGSEMQATSVDSLRIADVPCSNKTATESVTSEEMPQAGPTESMEQVNTAAVQTSNACTEANDADEDIRTAAGDTIDAVDVNKHSEAEQPSVNGDTGMQQSDELKNLDVLSTAVDFEPKLATNQTQQNFGAFHRLDHPANVVIDLRSPPLVQVCLLHGADDVGAGGSGSTGVHLRPQTARRGRRWLPSTTGRTTNATRSSVKGASLSDKDVYPHVTDLPSSQRVADHGNHDRSMSEKSTAELSTIIHLKVVDTPAEAVISGPSRFPPVTDNAVSVSQIQLHHTDGDHGSESSDDDSTMRVRNVNRTYSRNPLVPTAQKNPRLITTAISADHRVFKKGSEGLSYSVAGTTSRHAQGFKSVSRKSKKTGQQQRRIGPAWFSRRFLNAAPPEIWECARTSKAVKILKRPNYDSGVRHWPTVASPPTVKQVLEVPVVEEADIATVGREQLKLSRLSEDDVVELQSQLCHEAEHRRSERIMPLVMQMTDAQIEHAYEHVAESMKTYEIVEADSDEDEAEDEESEKEIADSYENGHHLESSDWSIYDAIGAKGVGETEYARFRPKRHAVDYGPSAFTPILIMEGRRLLSSQRKFSKASPMRSADIDKQDRSHAHKSCRRRRKKNRVTEPVDEMSVETPAEKCTDDSGELTGCIIVFKYSRIILEDFNCVILC